MNLTTEISQCQTLKRNGETNWPTRTVPISFVKVSLVYWLIFRLYGLRKPKQLFLTCFLNVSVHNMKSGLKVCTFRPCWNSDKLKPKFKNGGLLDSLFLSIVVCYLTDNVHSILHAVVPTPLHYGVIVTNVIQTLTVKHYSRSHEIRVTDTEWVLRNKYSFEAESLFIVYDLEKCSYINVVSFIFTKNISFVFPIVI